MASGRRSGPDCRVSTAALERLLKAALGGTPLELGVDRHHGTVAERLIVVRRALRHPAADDRLLSSIRTVARTFRLALQASNDARQAAVWLALVDTMVDELSRLPGRGPRTTAALLELRAEGEPWLPARDPRDFAWMVMRILSEDRKRDRRSMTETSVVDALSRICRARRAIPADYLVVFIQDLLFANRSPSVWVTLAELLGQYDYFERGLPATYRYLCDKLDASGFDVLERRFAQQVLPVSRLAWQEAVRSLVASHHATDSGVRTLAGRLERVSWFCDRYGLLKTLEIVKAICRSPNLSDDTRHELVQLQVRVVRRVRRAH